MGLGLSSLISTLATSLHSLQVVWLCFHLLCISCLYLSKQEFFIHPQRFLAPLAPFLPHWDASFLSLEKASPEYWQTFLNPSSLQGLLTWDYSKKIIKEAKVSSPEVHGCNLPCCPVTSSFNTKLYNLMVPTAKAAPNPHHQGLPCWLV